MCAHGDTVPIRVLVMAGLSHSGRDEWKTKPIDRCIAPLVAALQTSGVNMFGSCCGHGKQPGSIALDDGRELVIAANSEEARSMQAIYGTVAKRPPALSSEERERRRGLPPVERSIAIYGEKEPAAMPPEGETRGETRDDD